MILILRSFLFKLNYFPRSFFLFLFTCFDESVVREIPPSYNTGFVQVLPLTFVLKSELSARQNLTQSPKTLAEI